MATGPTMRPHDTIDTTLTRICIPSTSWGLSAMQLSPYSTHAQQIPLLVFWTNVHDNDVLAVLNDGSQIRWVGLQGNWPTNTEPCDIHNPQCPTICTDGSQHYQ